MIFDTLGSINYQSYSVYYANLIGLDNAVYLNAILNDYSRAHVDGRVKHDGYFITDTNYIKYITTFDENQQDTLKNNLFSFGLIDYRDENENHILPNVQMINGFPSIDDEKVLESIQRIKKNSNKKDKSEYVLRSVKKNIDKTLPSEIKTSISEWLDAIYTKHKFVNNTLLKKAESIISPIAKDDIKRAVGIMEICISNGYREIEWGIKRYDELHPNSVKTTVNTPVTLSTDFF